MVSRPGRLGYPGSIPYMPSIRCYILSAIRVVPTLGRDDDGAGSSADDVVIHATDHPNISLLKVHCC